MIERESCVQPAYGLALQREQGGDAMHGDQRANEFDVRLGEVELRLASDPRMRPWDEVAASELLLARHAWVAAEDRVLIWPAGHGGLAILAAQRTRPGLVTALDTNWAAANACRGNLGRYGLEAVSVRCGLPDADLGAFDVVVMPLPKGRATQRMYAAHAHAVLRPGGRLYVAGANDAGAKSAFRDLEGLFRPQGLLGYKGGHRAAAFARVEAVTLAGSYAEPGIAPGTWRAFAWEVAGRHYQARTTAGVFSWDHLDDGTRMLLEVVDIPADARVLDLGCGWGAIGAYAADRAREGAVTLVDVDALATRAAEATLHANRLGAAQVVLGDGAGAAGPSSYDLVLSNLPFHRGHGVDRQLAEGLVQEAARVLAPRGRLIIVANRFLRYEQVMSAVLANVRCLANDNRYHVWVGEAR